MVHQNSEGWLTPPFSLSIASCISDHEHEKNSSGNTKFIVILIDIFISMCTNNPVWGKLADFLKNYNNSGTAQGYSLLSIISLTSSTANSGNSTVSMMKSV